MQNDTQAAGTDRAEPALRQCCPPRSSGAASDISGLFDLRRIIADGAIRQTVLCASAKDLATLDVFRAPFPGEIGGFMGHHARFHLTIAQLTGNPHLVQEIARLIAVSEGAMCGRAKMTAPLHRALPANRAAIIGAVQARGDCAARSIRQ